MNLEDDLCPHYLNPNFSDNFLDDSEAEVQIELPYPIHRPFKNRRTDIIDQFHENAATYSKQLATTCKDFQLAKAKIMNQDFNESHATITRSLLDLCNTEKCNAPFPCDYNPYYATGFLEYFCLNDNHYLIRPDYKNKLRITNIVNPWKSGKLKLNTELEENIAGISATSINDGIFLLLRHKNAINLLKINNIDEIAEIKWNKTFKGAAIDAKLNGDRLGVAFSSSRVRLYDIETCKKISLRDDIALATRLDLINENTIALLNQNSLKILDYRSRDCRSLEPGLNGCDGLSAFRIDGNQVYVGTRHHLIRTDVRFFNNIEYCTHLMKASPCYMDLVSDRNDKFMCLSSQKVEDKVLFSGSPISSLPLHIPSICDSLTECKLRIYILLRDRLSERLQKSTGGIKLVCDNDGVSIYTANSLGEIFKQKIATEMGKEESTSLDSLSYWINKLPEPPKTMHVTNVANLSDVRFVLNKRIMDERLVKYKRKSKKTTLFLNHFNNVYGKKNLGDLAGNFASIWDDAEEEEEREEVDLVPEVAPLEKVSSWIESSYFFE